MEIHPQTEKECANSKEDRSDAEQKLLFHRLMIRIVEEAVPARGGRLIFDIGDTKCTTTVVVGYCLEPGLCLSSTVAVAFVEHAHVVRSDAGGSGRIQESGGMFSAVDCTARGDASTN